MIVDFLNNYQSKYNFTFALTDTSEQSQHGSHFNDLNQLAAVVKDEKTMVTL